MSQPSVSTMQLVTSSISPDASRASDASRSALGVEPSMCSARTPDLTNSSRRWIECATLTAKATVFRRSPNLCQCVTMSPTSLRLVHALGELRLDVIAGLNADASQIGIDRRIDARTNQIALLDQFRDLRALDDRFENATKPAPVAPAWCCRRSKQDRIRIGRNYCR